ncbi:MAG: TIGR03936 family radical SAM-associated protein [Acidimicrobiaceae bacterium]|nr:TIGR03936 family radical SAM-associated protein [Acidimicrobiaceae bacterium]
MRIRIRFTKHGKVRFTSHRDVARIFQRALRRAGLPVAYSQGFSPRPKIAFGLALSTGHESEAEYLDIDLDPERTNGLEMGDLPARLSNELPEGMAVTAAVIIDRRTASLQQAVTSCTWQIDVVDVDADTVAGAVARALAAESLVVTRERKGREVTDDLRPGILSLDVEGPVEAEEHEGSRVRLLAELATQPRALRVSELLGALDPPLVEHRVLRLHQWTTNETDAQQRGNPLHAAASALVGAT